MSSSDPIRIVVVASLFPNSCQPRHGIFVEQRLGQLLATGQVEARVIAPVPWFFSGHPRYGRYAVMARVPRMEYRHGVEVRHPRYLVVPKIGMAISPTSMAATLRRELNQLRRDGFDFDLIDAHYFYPDGVAAARVARSFDRDCVVTARGADLNTIAQMPVPRRRIRKAARRAAGLITVSESLARRLRPLVDAPDKIRVLRNGVDLTRFAPGDRDAALETLGLRAPVWLCVGHLIERKGFHLAIEALADVPDATLLITGDGEQHAALVALAERVGVSQRVRFVGAIEPDCLADYYTAADALILPTRSEGMPNVVLEALACGAAVIATNVDGIPEIMTGPPAGRLLAERSAAAIVSAWCALTPDERSTAGRRARRDYARRFDWTATTNGQLELFRDILDRFSQRSPTLVPGNARH